EKGHAYIAFDKAEALEAKRKEAESNGQHTWQYDGKSRLGMDNSLTLSKEEVETRIQSGEKHVIRLKVEPGQTVSFTDMVRGEVSFESDLVDDKVLIKADGMPTYHLAHIVDDVLMGITHAIRGEEWLPSAPAHILIYEYLGLKDKMPQYAHLPLLLKPEGNGKLSKRDGDRLGFPVFPLEWKDPSTGEISSGYREKGYYAPAFVNMLALLGWNPGTEQEVMSMEELIKNFSFDRVHKSGARFDPEKTKWFNEQYLRLQSDADIASRFAVVLNQKNIQRDLDFITAVVKWVKDRCQFESELFEKSKALFEVPIHYDEKVIEKRWNEKAKAFYSVLPSALESVNDFKAENVKSTFEATCASNEIKPGEVLQLFRVLLSGESGGPDLFIMTELLGKEEVIKRIEMAISTIK
ncbi:MAG: glutamate--tRNA ligase, partial [Bacteroidota bacterium]